MPQSTNPYIEGMPWWMKTRLAWVLVLLLAVSIGVLAWWSVVSADIKDEYFNQKMEEKEAAAQILEDSIREHRQNIAELSQEVALHRDRLKKAQTAAQQEETILRAKIRQLQQDRIRLDEDTQEEVEAIPDMEDVELAEAIQGTIQEKDPVAQVHFQIDHGFCLNRSAANQIQLAFVLEEDLKARLTLAQEETTAWESGFNSCQKHKEAALSLIQAVEASLAEHQEGFQTAMLLNSNQEERLAAQAERIKALEKKLFWNKWKTTIGIGAGVAVGFLVGKELQ